MLPLPRVGGALSARWHEYSRAAARCQRGPGSPDPDVPGPATPHAFAQPSALRVQIPFGWFRRHGRRSAICRPRKARVSFVASVVLGKNALVVRRSEQGATPGERDDHPSAGLQHERVVAVDERRPERGREIGVRAPPARTCANSRKGLAVAVKRGRSAYLIQLRQMATRVARASSSEYRP